MERPAGRKLITLGFALLLIPALAWPGKNSENHTKSYNDMIYHAYVYGKMHQWEEAATKMKQQYQEAPSDALLYDLLLAQYGLIGHYLEEDMDKKAEEQLAEAEGFLKDLEQAEEYKVQHLLFEASCKAFHIQLRPRRGMRLGPRSEKLIDEALELDNSYPRGHLEKGNMLFHAPRLFGGSKKKSTEHYAKAIALWDKTLPDNHRWLYLSTLVSLAKAQKETGDLDQAIATLEKALEHEPDFKWVRDELLPEWR